MGWFFGNKKEEVDTEDKFGLPSLPRANSALQMEAPSPRDDLTDIEITSIPDILPEIKESYTKIEPQRIETQRFETQRIEPQKFVPKPFRSEPIYVRLDKFETTIESIEEIKVKLEEMERLIIKDKQLKEQEERELLQWEKEVEIIKSRMDSIDRNLFEKLG